MAWYCGYTVRFKGRSFDVPLRNRLYGGGGKLRQVAGKPFRLTLKQQRQIVELAERQHCESGCCNDPE